MKISSVKLCQNVSATYQNPDGTMANHTTLIAVVRKRHQEFQMRRSFHNKYAANGWDARSLVANIGGRNLSLAQHGKSANNSIVLE